MDRSLISRSIFNFHSVLIFSVLCVRCAKRREEEGDRTKEKDFFSRKSAGAIDEGHTAFLARRQRSVQGKRAPFLPSLTNHHGGGNGGPRRRLWFYPVVLLFAFPEVQTPTVRSYSLVRRTDILFPTSVSVATLSSPPAEPTPPPSQRYLRSLQWLERLCLLVGTIGMWRGICDLWRPSRFASKTLLESESRYSREAPWPQVLRPAAEIDGGNSVGRQKSYQGLRVRRTGLIQRPDEPEEDDGEFGRRKGEAGESRALEG